MEKETEPRSISEELLRRKDMYLWCCNTALTKEQEAFYRGKMSAIDDLIYMLGRFRYGNV